MFKLLEKITEFIGWVQIVISPTLLGLGIGCIVYFNFQNLAGLILAPQRVPPQMSPPLRFFVA